LTGLLRVTTLATNSILSTCHSINYTTVARLGSNMNSSSNISLRQTIALTAVGTALITTGAIIGGQAIRRYARTEKLKESVYEDLKGSDEPWTSTTGNEEEQFSTMADAGPVRRDASQKEWEKGQFDEDLIREQVCTNSQLERLPRRFDS